MTIEHVNATDPDIHEPKGVAAASAGQAYLANGAGSGTWTTLASANKVLLVKEMTNISTAGSYWVVPGIAGTITQIHSILESAIGTADAAITFEINGTPITNGGLTIAYTGSAAGDKDVATPTANNTISATDAIELITDGASTTTAKLTVTFEIDVS